MSINQEQLFTLALELEKPWYVSRIEFDQIDQQIDTHLDFKPGSKFSCPGCGKETPVYDSEEHTWRHLNFFQHKAYLHARQPRTECPDCGVLTVNVPWARPKSDFTLFSSPLKTRIKRLSLASTRTCWSIGETQTRSKTSAPTSHPLSSRV